MNKHITVLFFFCCILLLDMPALCVEIDGARKFANRTTANIMSTMKAKDSSKTLHSKLVKIFLGVMDVEWISKFVVARKWNDIPDNLKAEYINAYSNYLASFYATKFSQYGNQNVIIQSVKPISKDQYIISTTAHNQVSGQSNSIAYRIKEYDPATYKIRDIVIEGISLLSAQRSEFSSIAANQGIPKLISLLKTKTAQNQPS